MEAVMLLVAVPLMILNMLGGLVGGIALAIQGEWGLLFAGIAWAFVAPFLLSIAMMPGMIFVPLSQWASERDNTVVALLAGLPSLVWTYVVVTASSILAFRYVVGHSDTGFLHLLWAYSVTTGPWSFLANKDRQAGNDASTTLMFFIQMGTVAMMVVSWMAPFAPDVWTLTAWFLPFMVLGALAQLLGVWVNTRSARYRGY